MKIDFKEGTIPLLRQILPQVMQGLTQVIDDIKASFSNLNRLMYVTLTHSGLTPGVKIGPSNLNSDTNEIVTKCYEKVNFVLESHQTLNCNETLNIYIVVLGSKHMKHIGEETKKARLVIDQLGGAGDAGDEMAKYCLKIPQHSSFKGFCIPLSLIMAACIQRGLAYKYFIEHRFKNDRERHYIGEGTERGYKRKGEWMSKFGSTNRNYRSRAFDTLTKEFEKMKRMFPRSLNKDPYSYSLRPILQKLAKHYKVNYVIHSLKYGKDNICLMESGSSTKEFNMGLPRCDLYWTDGNPFAHLECLKVQNYAYRKDFGWMCVFCYYPYVAHTRHLCSKFNACFPCKRIQILPEWTVLIYNKHTENLYCNSMNENDHMSCIKCRLQITGNNCYEDHKKLCLSRYLCTQCRQVLSNKNERIEVVKEEHKKVCGSKFVFFCSFCKKNHTNDDECQLTAPIIKDFENFPKLMFVTGAVANMDSGLCYKCHEEKCVAHLGKKPPKTCYKCHEEKCVAHLGKKPPKTFVNYLCILKERDFHGTFFRQFITANGIIEDDLKIDAQYPTTTDTNKTYDLPKVTNFARIKKNRLKNNISQTAAKTALDFLLKEILIKSAYSNCVAVVENHLMPFIIESIVHFNLPLPKDSNPNRVINLTTANFKFVSLNCYLQDHRKFANLEQTVFFPMILNSEDPYDFWPLATGQDLGRSEKPEFFDFLSLNDTFLVKDAKLKYYSSLDIEEWDFEDQLKRFLFENCSHIMLSMVKLAKLTSQMQNFLKKKIPCRIEKAHGSIFKCYSSAQFFYHLMVHYVTQKEEVPIYSLRNGETGIYSSNCSKAEFIFQHYTAYKRPQSKLFASHLSSYGCKTFSSHFPDVYDESKKEILNFHGR